MFDIAMRNRSLERRLTRPDLLRMAGSMRTPLTAASNRMNKDRRLLSRVGARLALVLMLVSTTAITVPPQPALATFSFANSSIADIALRYWNPTSPQWGGLAEADAKRAGENSGMTTNGQCIIFVYAVMYMAGQGN